MPVNRSVYFPQRVTNITNSVVTHIVSQIKAGQWLQYPDRKSFMNDTNCVSLRICLSLQLKLCKTLC